jgi:hypothetical protein
MTATIETISHGKLEECGFFSVYTKRVRFGDYCLSTKQFCEAVKLIAENPRLRSLTTIGYDVGFFDQGLDEYVASILGGRGVIIGEPARQRSGLDQSLKDSKRGSTKIAFQINSDASEIRVGKYLMEASEFEGFACYVARGGFGGWADKQGTPEYAAEAIRVLKTTQNDLFKNLRAKSSEAKEIIFGTQEERHARLVQKVRKM